LKSRKFDLSFSQLDAEFLIDERLGNMRAQAEKKIRHRDVCVRCAYKTSQSMLEVFLLFANAHTEKKTWGIYHIAFVPFFGLQDSDSAHWITRMFSKQIL
jgi:hypothetical protein